MQVIDHTGCLSRFLGIGYIPVFIKEPEVKIKQEPKIKVERQKAVKIEKNYHIDSSGRKIYRDCEIINLHIREFIDHFRKERNWDSIGYKTDEITELYNKLIQSDKPKIFNNITITFNRFRKAFYLVNKENGAKKWKRRSQKVVIVELFDQGMSESEIAIELNADPSNVYNALVKNDRIQKRTKKDN